MGFATKAIHTGQEPDPSTGAITAPIYQTSTYVQDALGRHKGFEYARTQNPTRAALERNLAALEGGIAAHCFASGMSAIDTVLRLLKAGDHVVVSENTYGGTYRLFEQVRMKQHDENRRKVASFLAEHPKVQKVYYPGLPQHPQYERAKRLMSGFGGMIAFETGSLAAAGSVLDNVRLCALAESLGGVETLISHPATMTHASVPAEERVRLGITDGLVRISVGIEEVEDIIADLDAALERA